MADACPCGSGDAYAECCKPVHDDPKSARTAEELMRARYSAYARGKIDFLEESLVPKARKDFKEGEIGRWSRESDWQELEVVSTSEGAADDTAGEVEFIARYESGGQDYEHHERAEFRQLSGQWYYVDGRIMGGRPVTRDAPKVGRNDPCPCGSGKKYKQCHGRAGSEPLQATG